MRRLFSILAVAATLFVLAGCSSDSNNGTTVDPAGATAEVSAGNTALANGDYAAANAHYKAAIAKDPGNTQAQFGAAITEVYLVQDDPDVSAAAGQFGLASRPVPVGSGRAARAGALAQRLAQMGTKPGEGYRPDRTGRALFKMLALAADDPDSLSELQAIVRTKVMPRLQYAEDRLNTIEAATDFQMFVPPAVSGLPDTIEIDKTEIYVLDTMINGVQGWLGLLVAYNFDVENMDYEHVSPESLLAPGTAWATLNTGGALQLAAARANLMNVKTKLDAAVAYLAAEQDPQYDDIISQDFLGTSDYTDLYNTVQDLYSTLVGPVLISVNDHAGQPFDLQFFLGRFFVPAIADLKTVLPHYSFVSGDPQIDDPIAFDDATINGIFPDMTNARWQQLTGLNGGAPPAAGAGPPLSRASLLRRH